MSVKNMIGHNNQPGLDRTFHFFSRLPAELRWKIWELNLPNPRLISIRCGSDDLACPPTSASDGPGRHSPFRTLSSSPPGCTSPARIPANLHTCHEARREALRYYQPAFGIAHQLGQIFFSPLSDILYFGPRDGFMAAEAQLRTVLTLCNPKELARVEKVAVNDAVFWTPSSPHNNSNSSAAAASGGQRRVASSLLIDVLRLLRERMPGLRELVFVPRDENPLYSGDACLVEPTMAQSRLARVVREAMGVVFCQAVTGEGRPWNWKIMTLSADADMPVYGRQVLGWEASAADEDVAYGNAHGPGYKRDRADNSKGREFARLSVLQESVRRQFMQMEMGAVPVLVE